MTDDNQAYLERLRKIQARLNKLSPADLEQATARLKRDIERVKQAESSTANQTLTCADCQEQLPNFVDDAAQGANPQLDYPHLWKHLQTCAACQAVYRSLWQTQTAPPSSATAPPWVIKTQATPARKSLHIQFNAQFLNSLFNTPTGPTFRALTPLPLQNSQMLTQVLLQEEIEWADQIFTVEIVYNQPPYAPTESAVLAKIIPAQALPLGLHAELIWGDQTFLAKVNPAGVAEFNHLPHQALQKTLADPTKCFELNFHLDAT